MGGMTTNETANETIRCTVDVSDVAEQDSSGSLLSLLVSLDGPSIVLALGEQQLMLLAFVARLSFALFNE